MIWTLSYTELEAAIATGQVSADEAFGELHRRIATFDSGIGAYLEVYDAERARGFLGDTAPGVPVSLKDNLVVRGAATTCASKILEGFVSPYTATAAQRLLDAGCLVQGRLNMDEFAMGSSTENSGIQKTFNPWNTACAPGGSSGGSAAAVAAGFTPAALGSDTGGSIRQPAAFCGVVGMKPTYGRISRYGLVAFASSLDQIGTFARTVEDTARLLEVLCGHDPNDATSAPMPAPELRPVLHESIDGIRIGMPAECFPDEGLNEEIRASIEHAVGLAEGAGARRVPVSLPHTKYAVATYYILATAEASSNLARFDGIRYGLRASHSGSLEDLYMETRGQGFGPEVKRRIMLGTYVLSAGYYDAFYRKAQQVRTVMARDFAAAFEQCDVILTPVTPTPPFRLGERIDDPLAMYLSDIYTIPVNLVGLPGLSLPCGMTSDGLPIGLQLVAPAWREDLLLRVAARLEERLGVRNRIAPLTTASAP